MDHDLFLNQMLQLRCLKPSRQRFLRQVQASWQDQVSRQMGLKIRSLIRQTAPDQHSLPVSQVMHLASITFALLGRFVVPVGDKICWQQLVTLTPIAMAAKMRIFPELGLEKIELSSGTEMFGLQWHSSNGTQKTLNGFNASACVLQRNYHIIQTRHMMSCSGHILATGSGEVTHPHCKR